jgi:hypothetical protein
MVDSAVLSGGPFTTLPEAVEAVSRIPGFDEKLLPLVQDIFVAYFQAGHSLGKSALLLEWLTPYDDITPALREMIVRLFSGG